MSDQDGKQATTLQWPTLEEQRACKSHWKAQGQSWRIEPEIDAERQQYLKKRINDSTKTPPFFEIKLSRADVEWLLATHENGCGPVDWSDPKQRNRNGPDLRCANLRGENLSGLPLIKANLLNAHLEGAYLAHAHLEGACLISAYLERANLMEAHLEDSSLNHAHLEGSQLNLAHLEGTCLIEAYLGGVILFNTYFDSTTRLDKVILSDRKIGVALLVDVHWSEVNIAVVDWSSISISGDERKAHEIEDGEGYRKPKHIRLEEYQTAVRAYRQLAVVLRNQGINDEANRFAYRAQLMQEIVYKRQQKYWQYLGSLFLDLLSGFGYKPIRSFLAYLIVILIFAIAYFIIGHTVGQPYPRLAQWYSA